MFMRILFITLTLLILFLSSSLSERRSLAPCGRENDGHKALCCEVLRQAASAQRLLPQQAVRPPPTA